MKWYYFVTTYNDPATGHSIVASNYSNVHPLVATKEIVTFWQVITEEEAKAGILHNDVNKYRELFGDA